MDEDRLNCSIGLIQYVFRWVCFFPIYLILLKSTMTNTCMFQSLWLCIQCTVKKLIIKIMWPQRTHLVYSYYLKIVFRYLSTNTINGFLLLAKTSIVQYSKYIVRYLVTTFIMLQVSKMQFYEISLVTISNNDGLNEIQFLNVRKTGHYNELIK